MKKPTLRVFILSGIALLCLAFLAIAGEENTDKRNVGAALEFKETSAKEVRNILSGLNIPDRIDPRNPDMADMSKPPSEWLIPSYFIAQYDLNDDGEDEIFLYRAGAGMCGSAGCQMSLYRRQGSGAYHAVQDWIVYQDIKIYEDEHNGYHDIGFPLRWPVDGANYNVLRWNGGKYIFANILGAQKIEFSNSDYSAEREKIYEFFKKEIDELNADAERVKKFGKTDEKAISVNLTDLNNDGTQEIIAVVYAYPTFCWGTGCSIFIFRQNQDKPITQIFKSAGKGGWLIGSESTNGYKNLIYYNDVPKLQTNVWQWDGQSYVYSERTS